MAHVIEKDTEVPETIFAEDPEKDDDIAIIDKDGDVEALDKEDQSSSDTKESDASGEPDEVEHKNGVEVEPKENGDTNGESKDHEENGGEKRKNGEEHEEVAPDGVSPEKKIKLAVTEEIEPSEDKLAEAANGEGEVVASS